MMLNNFHMLIHIFFFVNCSFMYFAYFYISLPIFDLLTFFMYIKGCEGSEILSYLRSKKLAWHHFRLKEDKRRLSQRQRIFLLMVNQAS